MPASAFWHCTDPDEFTARVRATSMELAIIRSGRFAAKLVRIDLQRMWLQRLSDSLPRVAHFNHVPGRAVISFRTQAGPDILWDGKVEPAGLARHPECYSFFQRSSGPTQLGTMSLPIEVMAVVGETFGGCDFTPPKELTFITPRPTALTKLLGLHATAGLLAENAPEIIACPEAARSLEQALIAAVADCLAATDEGSLQVSNCHHGRIMRRFYAILEANSDRVMHAPEMCKAVGVSNRTLTTCCHEALGISSSLPSATAVTSRPSCAGAGRPSEDHSYPDRHRARLLGSRTFRRGIRSDVRREAFRDPRPAGRLRSQSLYP